MNQELEKAAARMKTYKEDSSKENLAALIEQVRKTAFLVPSILPPNVDKQAIKHEAVKKNNGVVKLPEDVRPIPCIITNKEGSRYLPLYTSQDQIPKDPPYDLLMTLPFKAAYLMALNEKSTLNGLVLNAFSENLMFKEELLKAIQREEDGLAKQEQGQSEQKQIKLTPAQFQIMMRQKVEFHDFPLLLFKEKSELVDSISQEGESRLNNIYQSVYPDGKLYPFSEKDFSVMALNIREDLLLLRLDLPQIKESAQLCHRIYITLNPQSQEIHYFTIERGKEKDTRNLGEIDLEGKRVEHGPAPVEGAEISYLMELMDKAKE